MVMKRWMIFVGVCIVVAVLVAVLFSYPKNEKSVRIGYLPIMARVFLYSAVDREMFGNMTYELVEFRSTNQLIDAVLRGDVDVGVGVSTVPVFDAALVEPDSIKVFAVSDVTAEHPLDALITAENITTLAGLKGKKIGVFPGSTSKILVDEFLRSRGVNVSGIEYVDLVPQLQLAALQSGSVDVVHAYEPTVTQAKLEGMHEIYGSVYAAQFDHNPLGVFVFSSHFSSDYERANEVKNVFCESFDYVMAHEPDVRTGIMQEQMKLSQAVVEDVPIVPFECMEFSACTRLGDYADYLFNLNVISERPAVEGLCYGISASRLGR